MAEGEGKGLGIIAGLAVALGGGIVVLALLVLLFRSMDSSSASSTVTVTAAATTSTAPATTAAAATSQPAEVVLGARTYVAFACGACHGWKGEGGVSPAVPPLNVASQEFTPAQLRAIINHGAPSPLPADPKQPFMPVWGPVISDQQVSALVAYINAKLPTIEGIAPPDVPAGASDEVAGSILYQSYGCINCHGPNGLGGVPNPANPAGEPIPALSGADFRKEFNTPEKISSIILDGSVLGSSARPIVSMPHWRGILTDAEVAQLVAFIDTLKKR